MQALNILASYHFDYEENLKCRLRTTSVFDDRISKGINENTV
jgi:hypothetical protein